MLIRSVYNLHRVITDATQVCMVETRRMAATESVVVPVGQFEAGLPSKDVALFFDGDDSVIFRL